MNQLTKSRSTKGFTLIELMLAMTFISILLLTIALTIVQIATIYNRGMIAKEVNVSSRAISTELTSALTSSSTFSLSTGNHYVENAYGGRLCTGDYSYIWNYATALSPLGTFPNPTASPNRNMYLADIPQPDLAANVVKINGGTSRYEISLVKAPDSGGTYCTPNGSTYPPVKEGGATELLRTGDYGIVLYDLQVTTSTKATDALSGQELYKITFVLGTPNANAMNGSKATTTCKPPGALNSDANYCAVQRFTLVVRVVNGVN